MQLAELSRLLLDGRSGSPDPERVVRFAAAAVGGAEDCGLTLIRGSQRPETVAAAADLSPAVDSIQYDTQLVSASQHLNRKLRDIAAEVAETGRLPEVPPRRGRP